MLQALPAVESLADTPRRIRFSVFMRTYSVPAAAAATYIGEEDLLLRVLGSELFVHLACSHFWFAFRGLPFMYRSVISDPEFYDAVGVGSAEEECSVVGECRYEKWVAG